MPPRDALATAQRIATASRSSDFNTTRPKPLYYLDLNAISPKTSRQINDLFIDQAPHVRFIDGGIIGGPPHLKDDGTTWYRPSIPISGPHPLTEAEPSGSHLADILNTKYMNAAIGTATGLKMCYASLTKGFTALAIQSFTTAHNLGVLSELKAHMEANRANEVEQRLKEGQAQALSLQ